MEQTRLRALSPADGRYADKVGDLRDILSEFGLIRYRVLVEIRWLQWLADEPGVAELPPLSSVMKDVLNRIVDDFNGDDAERIKKIEATTNHDVKAVEYYLRERIGSGTDTRRIGDFIHFACTSEDINNLAYALMLRTARAEVLQPQMRELTTKLRSMCAQYAGLAMMSRTHGQAASPTTLGKELANAIARLSRAREQFAAVEIRGKFNGAVGNFNAHVAAYPDVDWPSVAAKFVASLGLVPNDLTTQIEPHDWTAEYAHALARYDTVLLDFCRDIWGYVSLGYFRQRHAKDEVGSSTMPHKVNPIDFENAEGNLGLANALLDHFAAKLPISRWQRDLTDSTVQRNFGVAIAYVLIAIKSAIRGLGKLQANPQAISHDIDQSWEVIGEAVQTVMRRYGVPEPYEKLKELTRGRVVDQKLMQDFIQSLKIPDDAKQRLLELTPSSYTGLAEALAKT
ncbi:MAG: adenylosuccinate lyase [Gammaproteobacteria bacterium]|nr:MAG: adenylosuccinate lyase [Gammaproteobacteria bacterium]